MRILIVEDEHKIANSIKQGLEQEGFAIDVAFNGTEGFDLASSEDYDLLILDLMLPGMDGVSISNELRKENIQTPILMLTAKTEIEDKLIGFKNGADDYLTKPFAFTELLARIRALLRRPSNILPDEIKCDDLIINTQTYVVKRGQKEISLSRKEFSLLEYLVRNKNKVVTKDQIINHVWSYDSDILPNTVEVYMGYLRNKIDKSYKGKRNLINTIRGFGYSIKCGEER